VTVPIYLKLTQSISNNMGLSTFASEQINNMGLSTFASEFSTPNLNPGTRRSWSRNSHTGAIPAKAQKHTFPEA
jgi:hypothetical protein